MISILLVDNDLTSPGSPGVFFKKQGNIDLDTAGSAVEALEKIRMYSYDAIVSDYLLPGMNGVELWKRLRAEKDLTPFIIYADQGWEDLVIETLGNEDVGLFLRNGEQAQDLPGLKEMIENAVRVKAFEAKKALFKDTYEQLLHGIQEGILSVDAHGKIEFVNGRMVEILGRPEEDIIGHSFLLMLEHPDVDAIASCLNSRGENMTRPLDITLLHGSGERISARLSASPRSGKENQYTGMLFIVSDVTQQQREQKAIKDELECLREIVHKSSDAVLVIGGNGTIELANTAAAMLFDVDVGRMRGDNPGFPLIIETPVTAGVIGNKRTIVEMRMSNIQWAGKPAYLATLRDVTSYYEAQARIRKVRDELYGG